MSWLSLLALACALAMDAFAVAIVTGLTLERLTGRHIFRLAFHFGLFQALMPTIGWWAGHAVRQHIQDFDHWIALVLLSFVGGKMAWGALERDEEEARAEQLTQLDPTSGWSLVILSVATSIDALAVGLSLSIIGSTIAVPALVIGLVAGAFTVVGMVLGRRIGTMWGKRVELLGGLILIAIGVKIVVEHLTVA